MESDHFFLVVTDVEGKILKCNRGFESIHSDPLDLQFSTLLSTGSEEEFQYSLDLMLGTPKIRRHLMLDHPSLQPGGSSQVWWEFSVLTTPDMDISGIFGIGVGLQFLEQDMPWNSLVDVLGFGEISLDSQFKVKSWDQRISNWFDPHQEKWKGSYLLDIFSFQDFGGFSKILSQISLGDKPKCFLINSKKREKSDFAALITMAPNGYHLFLMPKPSSFRVNSQNPPLSNQLLGLLHGAIFVLDKAGILLQQNDAARHLGKIWKGERYIEGYYLDLPDTFSFSKLKSAIQRALVGKDEELEIRNFSSPDGFSCWKVILKPISDELAQTESLLVQVLDITTERSELKKMSLENKQLREYSAIPSHILRGPLSSIMGILELMDPSQLDCENQKLFSHLKPLTRELDQAIRKHSKKMSTFS